MENMTDIANELEGLSQGQEQPTETPTVEADKGPLYEFEFGGAQHKIPLSHELPVKHNGQMVKAPLEQILNAWREREHFADKYKSFNSERAEFESTKSKFGDPDQLAQLQNLQKWSVENAEDFEAIWKLHEDRKNALNGGGDDNPLSAIVREQNEQLRGLMEFKKSFEETQAQKEEAEMIEQVNNDIKEFSETIGKKYGIDLNEVDEEGVKLETRILQHGIDKNIDDFNTAASSYLLPRIAESATQLGRTETVKAVKSDKRAGIIGRSETPNGETTFNPRSMSEEQLKEQALAELTSMLNS